MNNQFPKITQDGRDGDEEIGFIANMKDSAAAGFVFYVHGYGERKSGFFCIGMRNRKGWRLEILR